VSQVVEQSGFAGIGVTNQRDNRNEGSFTIGAVTLAVLADFFKIIF
jgi:hypothetical protein